MLKAMALHEGVVRPSLVRELESFRAAHGAREQLLPRSGRTTPGQRRGGAPGGQEHPREGQGAN